MGCQTHTGPRGMQLTPLILLDLEPQEPEQFSLVPPHCTMRPEVCNFYLLCILLPAFAALSKLISLQDLTVRDPVQKAPFFHACQVWGGFVTC